MGWRREGVFIGCRALAKRHGPMAPPAHQSIFKESSSRRLLFLNCCPWMQACAVQNTTAGDDALLRFRFRP